MPAAEPEAASLSRPRSRATSLPLPLPHVQRRAAMSAWRCFGLEQAAVRWSTSRLVSRSPSRASFARRAAPRSAPLPRGHDPDDLTCELRRPSRFRQLYHFGAERHHEHGCQPPCACRADEYDSHRPMAGVARTALSESRPHRWNARKGRTAWMRLGRAAVILSTACSAALWSMDKVRPRRSSPRRPKRHHARPARPPRSARCAAHPANYHDGILGGDLRNSRAPRPRRLRPRRLLARRAHGGPRAPGG